jgi:hypothetical protein
MDGGYRIMRKILIEIKIPEEYEEAYKDVIDKIAVEDFVYFDCDYEILNKNEILEEYEKKKVEKLKKELLNLKEDFLKCSGRATHGEILDSKGQWWVECPNSNERYPSDLRPNTCPHCDEPLDSKEKTGGGYPLNII